MAETEYAWGRSKIFIRNPKALFDIEEKRHARNLQLIIKIQAIYRGWKNRAHYQKLKKAQITFSSQFRSIKLSRKYNKTRNAAILLQSYVRMWRCRKDFLKQKYAERDAALARERAERDAAVARERAEQEDLFKRQSIEQEEFDRQLREQQEEHERRLREEREELERRRRAEQEALERKRREEAAARERKRRNDAASLIAAFAKGWIVRKRTRPLFRFELCVVM